VDYASLSESNTTLLVAVFPASVMSFPAGTMSLGYNSQGAQAYNPPCVGAGESRSLRFRLFPLNVAYAQNTLSAVTNSDLLLGAMAPHLVATPAVSVAILIGDTLLFTPPPVLHYEVVTNCTLDRVHWHPTLAPAFSLHLSEQESSVWSCMSIGFSVLHSNFSLLTVPDIPPITDAFGKTLSVSLVAGEAGDGGASMGSHDVQFDIFHARSIIFRFAVDPMSVTGLVLDPAIVLTFDLSSERIECPSLPPPVEPVDNFSCNDCDVKAEECNIQKRRCDCIEGYFRSRSTCICNEHLLSSACATSFVLNATEEQVYRIYCPKCCLSDEKRCISMFRMRNFYQDARFVFNGSCCCVGQSVLLQSSTTTRVVWR